MTTSLEDKLKIVAAFTVLAADIDRYPNLSNAAKDAAMQAIGKPIVGATLRRWSKDGDEVAELLCAAYVERAEAYMALANKTMMAVEEFWESEHRDCRGDVYFVKHERMNSVNKARLIIESCRWNASHLAPDAYGDYLSQIKKIEENLKAMSVRIENIINNKT